MRKITTIVLSSMLAAALSACSTTEEQPPAATVQFPAMAQVGDNAYATGETLTMQATVVSIDQADRFVVLQGEDGEQVGFRVGPEVKNLPQVRKGDVVTVGYHQSIAVQLRKPGEAEPGIEGAEGVATAKPGQMPGAAGARTVTVTATIKKIDKDRGVVTLVGPKGRAVDVLVRNRDRLEGVKKGDLVEITYTEAVAVAVEKVK